MKPVQELISTAPQSSFYSKMFVGPTICDTDRWHFHPEYEIVYVRNGSGICHVGDYKGDYLDGILLFIGPNIPHFPLSNTKRPDNIEVVIQFSEDFLKGIDATFYEFKELEPLIESSNQVLSFGSKTRNYLDKEMMFLEKAKGMEKVIYLLKIFQTLNKAEDKKVLSKSIHPVHDHAFERVKKVYDYISNHYDENITIAAIASEIGLTENSLCRYFKQHTGGTVFEFIQEFRIARACQMLQERERISEVAYACGFNDPSYFNKQFKKIMRMSPKEFRQNIIDQKTDHTHHNPRLETGRPLLI